MDFNKTSTTQKRCFAGFVCIYALSLQRGFPRIISRSNSARTASIPVLGDHLLLHSFSRCKYVRSRYYDVQALYDAGIIRGVSATKFNPYGTLTRQQAALMLVRTLEYLGVEKESNTGPYHIAIKLVKKMPPKMKKYAILSVES
ncbi:S-layer homology domain-containing protein [Peribacillus sp. NPDC006672]|uniref:S-layer homology domain-containing protein n=1 Tax=Peribacillus sp. NPDC006672 TaxID=3390606 RepID=UPI003D046068